MVTETQGPARIETPGRLLRDGGSAGLALQPAALLRDMAPGKTFHPGPPGHR